MYTDHFDQWFKINKLGAQLGEIHKATSDSFKRITEESIDLMEENLARYSSQLKRLAEVKSLEELPGLQKDCISENIAAAAQNLQRFFQLGLEAQEEILKKMNHTAAKTMDKTVEKARAQSQRE